MKSLSTAVPCVKINKEDLSRDFKTLLTETTNYEIFKSKSELIRLIKNNGLSINKEKISDDNYKLSDNLKFNKHILSRRVKRIILLLLSNKSIFVVKFKYYAKF